MIVDPRAEEDPSFVTALARGLAVIRAFDSGPDAMTMADIARATGLPRASVRRALFTLEALGYVASDGRNHR
ncbi:MAG: helix-turn-helix domain-containing protein, partial [Elsteraceae bacterium]